MSSPRERYLKKNKLALVGKGIKHSKSQQMYEELLGRDVDYTLLDYPDEQSIPPIGELMDIYEGVSITAPYKHVFIPQCKVDPFFQALDAINCIGRIDGEIRGTNTDYLALEELIENEFCKFDKIILLGDGAMARITIALFEKLKIAFDQYSRKLNPDFAAIDFLEQADQVKKFLIINACGRSFQFDQPLKSNVLFYDYNYSHKYHTEFFKNTDGEYRDGLELLKSQARYALKFWNVEA